MLAAERAAEVPCDLGSGEPRPRPVGSLPVQLAALTTDQAVALCDELLKAHGDLMPRALRRLFARLRAGPVTE
jgi:alpha-galactosidase/6-phospho-beta-glucosidase family protein